jgi:hypothetical protein
VKPNETDPALTMGPILTVSLVHTESKLITKKISIYEFSCGGGWVIE